MCVLSLIEFTEAMFLAEEEGKTGSCSTHITTATVSEGWRLRFHCDHEGYIETSIEFPFGRPNAEWLSINQVIRDFRAMHPYKVGQFPTDPEDQHEFILALEDSMADLSRLIRAHNAAMVLASGD